MHVALQVVPFNKLPHVYRLNRYRPFPVLTYIFYQCLPETHFIKISTNTSTYLRQVVRLENKRVIHLFITAVRDIICT